MFPDEYRVLKFLYRRFGEKPFTNHEAQIALGKRFAAEWAALVRKEYVQCDLGQCADGKRICNCHLTRLAISSFRMERRRRIEIFASISIGLVAAIFSVLTYFKPS